MVEQWSVFHWSEINLFHIFVWHACSVLYDALIMYTHYFMFIVLYSQLSKGSLRRKCLQGNLVAETLDCLMVLTFDHLESCHSCGRLAQVFPIQFLDLFLFQLVCAFLCCINDWLLWVGQILCRFSMFFWHHFRILYWLLINQNLPRYYIQLYMF